jgi:NhaP-type Na+/H+ or K+/H+ antiporter|tara:strand:+ start:2104 stop:3387 length:1284 start_codon:yes stop_codon:yes gene_type:complete
MEHQIASSVLSVGLLVFVAHFFTALFERTKVPDVLPLILIGIVIGPTGLNFVDESNFGNIGSILSAIALALMLFEGGSHLTFETLRSTLRDCVLLSICTFFITAGITFSILYFVLQQELLPALYIGAVLGSISPAVVVPIVRGLKISEITKSTLVVESAISDVLSIVLALSILKAFQAGGTTLGHFIGTNIIATMAMSIMVGFGGAIIWSTILEKIRKFPNTIFTSLAFLFILYGLSEVLGYNGPVTTLIFGLVLANSKKIPLDIIQRFGADRLIEFTSIEKTLFSEIIFLVKTFFFVYLGISIKFGQIYFMSIGLLLTIIIYGSRLFLVKYLTPKETSQREAALIAFIIPKGLAAAVLAEIPIHMDFNQHAHALFLDVQSIVYAVIFFSILLTAILIYREENRNSSSPFIKKFFKDFRTITSPSGE